MESFKIMGPALPVFRPKLPIFFHIFHLKKYLWQNIGSFSPFQKEITSFCSKMCIK